MYEIGNKMHKIPSLGAYYATPDLLVGWRGDRRLRRLYYRAFGTRLGACGVSILPYHFYVLGAAFAYTYSRYITHRSIFYKRCRFCNYTESMPMSINLNLFHLFVCVLSIFMP